MSVAAPTSRLAATHWPVALVCALFLVVGALTLDAHGIDLDTTYQRAIGNAALDYLAGDGERAFGQLGYFHDRYYGAVFEAPLVLILERIMGLEDSRDVLLGRHLLTHLFFLAGGVFCYLLVLRLFNNRWLALVALVLFLLHPRIYAHSFYNSKDVPFLAAFMVALWLVHRAFRRDTLGAFLLCGVGVGLLANLRIMGIMLFAAVLMLRALDLAFAGSADGRKRILLTGAAFALAAVLTFYASLPALWTDPVGRFAEMVEVLRSHPVHRQSFFRGELLSSADGAPFDYVPVWVGITTPPATLLLAFAGAVALAWGGLRRPRDVLRDGPLRFGLLLAALPIATVAAVIVLESNLHNAWQHLYFLYAPLLLLAAVGLRWLTTVARGRWPRAGAYALMVAGVAVTIVSMIRIHPFQDDYFNSLVDRTTPQRLSSLYTVNYWRMSGLHLLNDIIRDYPSGELHLSIGHLGFHRTMLPADDRERIVVTRDFRSGERNFFEIHARECQPSSPPPARRFWARRIYASMFHCVIDPAPLFERLRREALASGEPLVRSTYDIHRDGRRLTYVRDGCPVDDTGRQFFLHVTPVDASEPLVHAFDHRDFPFARIDGNCVASVVLPAYPIAGVRTGQLSREGVLWEADIAFTPPAVEPAALAGEPLACSAFDVHRHGGALIYVRDGCTDEDAGTMFFLHVVPVDARDLPDDRWRYGFDNLDFRLWERGGRDGDRCIAVVPLPAYPIATVRTGQYDATGALWTAEFALPDGE